MSALLQSQYKNPLSMDIAPLTSADQNPANFGEAAPAALRFSRDEGLFFSRGNAYAPLLDERHQAIVETLGRDPGFVTHYPIDPEQPQYRDAQRMVGSGAYTLDDNLELQANTPEAQRSLGGRFDNRTVRAMALVKLAQRLNPEKVKGDEELSRLVATDLATKRKANIAISARGGMAARLVGTAAGIMTDPMVLATLPLGYGWLGSGSILINAAKAFSSEALIGAASEAVIQAEVYAFKQQIESPYSKADAILNVLSAGLGAGVLRATAGSLIDVGIKVLNRAGIDPQVAKTILAEVESREASKPINVSGDAHSAAIDLSMYQVGRGELARVDDIIPSAALLDTPELRHMANELDIAEQADLIATAGTKLSRGERKSLEAEISNLTHDLSVEAEISNLTHDLSVAGGLERLEELRAEASTSGLTGKKAKAKVARDQSADVERLTGEINRRQEILQRDLVARDAESRLSRLEAEQRVSRLEAEQRVSTTDMDHGIPQPVRLSEATRYTLNEHRAISGTSWSAAREATSPVARFGGEAPVKVKVDKGTGEVLRAKPVESRVEPVSTRAIEAPAGEPLSYEHLHDIDIAANERADGSIEVKSLKDVLATIDDDLVALDKIGACLARGG